MSEFTFRPLAPTKSVTVLSDQGAVSKAHEAFAANGSLSNDKQSARMQKLGAQLARHLAKMKA